MALLKRLFVLFIILNTLVFFNGCKEESDPVTPASQHFSPEGWMIRDATMKPILVIWQGVVQQTWEGVAVEDTMLAPLNALSDHYSIKFLDENKKIISAPSGTDYKMGVIISDTSKLGYVQDSPTDWAFHLKGKKVGTTQVELQVQHNGHVDVKTPKFYVSIIVDTTAHGEAEGLRLKYEEDGTILSQTTRTSSNGSITLKADSTTDHIEIEFFDENGHYFQPEVPLHSWAYTLSDATIASILPETNEPWVLRIKGLKKGTTKLTLKLMVSGEAEFTGYPITIEVQ